MAHPRTFRFGAQLTELLGPGELATVARRVEETGYSVLLLPDHFGDHLAPVPALAAIAAATSTLRIGSLVFANDFKHPVVLAKEAATLDVLSEGRLEFGIGAGWLNTDYEQSGIPKDRDAVRIARLAEAIQVCRGLWAGGPYTFSGEHYRITALDGQPKPVQHPHPPILVGGGGPRMLALAGREADIVGINPRLTAGAVTLEAAQDSTAQAVDRKLAWVKESAGDRFDDLELNVLVFSAAVTDDRLATAERMGQLFGVSAEEMLDAPHAWFGTVDDICDALRRWRDRWGISYFTVQSRAAVEAMAPVVERLTGT